jgi:hypothetical protein
MVLFHPLKFTKRVRFDHTKISTESDEPQSESSPYLGQNLFWLVVFRQPSEKSWSSSVRMMKFSSEWKKTCSKPPNSSFVYVQSLIRTISIGKIPDITRKFFYGQERTNFGTYRFLGSIFQSFLRCQENRYTARDDYCCSICLYISSIRGKQIMKKSPPVTGSPAALTPKPYNLHLMIIGIKHVKQ